MSDEKKDMLQKQQECRDFFTEQSKQYLPRHKKLVKDAQYFKGKVAGFEWKFVDSLTEQVEEGKPLTYRQYNALRKIVYKLQWDFIESKEVA